MTVQKQLETLWNAVTLNGGAVDLVAALLFPKQGYGTTILRRITNGATGPTAQATIAIEVSIDGVTWFSEGSAITGGSGNNVVTEELTFVSRRYPYIRLIAGQNTVQNVVVDVFASTVLAE